MDRKRDGKGSEASAKHISMELTADGARVTNLSLNGSRLILTIEAELADSRLNAGAEIRDLEADFRREVADARPIADVHPDKAAHPEVGKAPFATPAPGPVASPIAPPIAPPIASPVAPPVASPVAPPVAPPIAPPIAPPVAETVPEVETESPSLTVDSSMIAPGDDDEVDVPSFASDAAEASVFSEDEDAMGGLPISSYQAAVEPEPVMPRDVVLALGEEPGTPGAAGFSVPGTSERPSAGSPFNREISAKSIPLANGLGGQPMDGVREFAAPPIRESHRLKPPPAATPISLDTGPLETDTEEESEEFSLGFGESARAEERLVPPAPGVPPSGASGGGSSLGVIGFAPAYQEAPATAKAVPPVPPAPASDIPGFSLAEDDGAWNLQAEPPSPKPSAQKAEAPSSGRNLWAPEPEMSLVDAPNRGAWESSAPKKEEPAPPPAPPAPEKAKTAGELSGRASWTTSEPGKDTPGSGGDWGGDVPRHANDSGAESPRPVTETWDASSLDSDTFPAIAEESNAVGGERHGEPQPAISYGVSPGVPSKASAPREEPGANKDAAPRAQAPRAREQADPGPAQSGEKPDQEPGGTTVLIRYTCPKCKTQGMQAVDKVGTVVNCSNCGKAMRLVMKK